MWSQGFTTKCSPRSPSCLPQDAHWCGCIRLLGPDDADDRRRLLPPPCGAPPLSGRRNPAPDRVVDISAGDHTTVLHSASTRGRRGSADAMVAALSTSSATSKTLRCVMFWPRNCRAGGAQGNFLNQKSAARRAKKLPRAGHVWSAMVLLHKTFRRRAAACLSVGASICKAQGWGRSNHYPTIAIQPLSNHCARVGSVGVLERRLVGARGGGQHLQG